MKRVGVTGIIDYSDKTAIAFAGNPDIANKCDDCYVPSCFVCNDNVMESVPSRKAIEKVFSNTL